MLMTSNSNFKVSFFKSCLETDDIKTRDTYPTLGFVDSIDCGIKDEKENNNDTV